MTLIPSLDSTGINCCFSLPNACSFDKAKSLGILGPVISASIIPTFKPFLAIALANITVTVDLPTPPLPDITVIIFLMWLSGLD